VYRPVAVWEEHLRHRLRSEAPVGPDEGRDGVPFFVLGVLAAGVRAIEDQMGDATRMLDHILDAHRAAGRKPEKGDRLIGREPVDHRRERCDVRVQREVAAATV
jgi:hypothetical protein